MSFACKKKRNAERRNHILSLYTDVLFFVFSKILHLYEGSSKMLETCKNREEKMRID